jgi:hypothetical protein
MIQGKETWERQKASREERGKGKGERCEESWTGKGRDKTKEKGDKEKGDR